MLPADLALARRLIAQHGTARIGIDAEAIPARLDVWSPERGDVG